MRTTLLLYVFTLLTLGLQSACSPELAPPASMEYAYTPLFEPASRNFESVSAKNTIVRTEQVDILKQRAENLLQLLEDSLNVIGNKMTPQGNHLSHDDADYLRARVLKHLFTGPGAYVNDDRIAHALNKASVPISIEDYLNELQYDYASFDISLKLNQLCSPCHDPGDTLNSFFLKAVINRKVKAQDFRGRQIALNGPMEVFFRLGKDPRGNFSDYLRIEHMRPQITNNCECTHPTSAITTLQDSASANFIRGALAHQREFYHEAREYFTLVLRAAADYTEARFNRANGAIYQNHDLALAIRDLDRVIFESEQQHPKAFYARGVARLMQGDYEKALKDVSRALEEMPDLADAHFVLAYIQYQEYSRDKAIEHVHLAREKGTTLQGETYFLQGMLHYDEGKYEKAVEAFSKALGYMPKSADLYYNRGLAAYLSTQQIKRRKLSDETLAPIIRDFEQCLELDEGYAPAHQNLAVVYWLHDRKEARKYLKLISP